MVRVRATGRNSEGYDQTRHSSPVVPLVVSVEEGRLEQVDQFLLEES